MKFNILNSSSWGNNTRMVGGVGTALGKLYEVEKQLKKNQPT
jgi:hypothetical protein